MRVPHLGQRPEVCSVISALMVQEREIYWQRTSECPVDVCRTTYTDYIRDRWKRSAAEPGRVRMITRVPG